MAQDDCSFCHLLAGEGDLSIAASDELTVAFLDAFPVAAGHVLVVPRRHVTSLGDLTPAEGSALWAMTQHLSARIRAELAPAVNLHLSDGPEAGQDVPHVHLHIIPRHAGDQVVLDLPGDRVTRESLDRVAAQLSGR